MLRQSHHWKVHKDCTVFGDKSYTQLLGSGVDLTELVRCELKGSPRLPALVQRREKGEVDRAAGS